MDKWTGFFSAIAAVSAAIIAIAFLTFQVKSEMWRRDKLLNHVAIFTLTEFGTPLVTGLIFLMPSHPWRIAAIIVGVAGLGLVGSYWKAYRTKDKPSDFDRLELRLSIISLVRYSLLIVAGLLPQDFGSYLLASLLVWFLISGSIESWWLLEPKGMDASEGEPGGVTS